MKKYTIILYFLCLNSAVIFAQQLPRFTQTILNPMLVNPAMVGVGGYGSPRYVSANLLYRNQWAGIQGAPTTVAATIQGSFLGTEKANYHHGTGVSVINESVGAWNRFSGSATYAQQRVMSKNKETNEISSYLSAGISFGLVNYHLDPTKVVATNINDVAAFSAPKGFAGSLDVGLMFHSKSFFAGLSMNQLVGSKIDDNNKLVRHFTFTAGGLIARDGNPWGFAPSIIVRGAAGSTMQIEMNGLVRYKENFWVGTSYRFKDGVSVLLGGRFELIDDVPMHLSYSYDFANSSNVSAYSSGSHEIMLGFRFRKHNHGKSGYHGDNSTKVKMWN